MKNFVMIVSALGVTLFGLVLVALQVAVPVLAALGIYFLCCR